MNIKRRRHSNQFKFKVALEAGKGLKTLNEIASAYNRHPNQFSSSRKQLLTENKGYSHYIGRLLPALMAILVFVSCQKAGEMPAIYPTTAAPTTIAEVTSTPIPTEEATVVATEVPAGMTLAEHLRAEKLIGPGAVEGTLSSPAGEIQVVRVDMVVDENGNLQSVSEKYDGAEHLYYVMSSIEGVSNEYTDIATYPGEVLTLNQISSVLEPVIAVVNEDNQLEVTRVLSGNSFIPIGESGRSKDEFVLTDQDSSYLDQGSSETTPTSEPAEQPPETPVERVTEEAEALLVANFEAATNEAVAQYPEFAAAFDSFPETVSVKSENGDYYQFSVQNGRITYEVINGTLMAMLRLENTPEITEFRWVPFNVPGVETKGFWGEKEFSTELITFLLGDAKTRAAVFKERRGIRPPSGNPTIAGLEPVANTYNRYNSVDQLGDYFGNSRESLIEYFNWVESQSDLRYPYKDEVALYESVDDPNIDETAMIDRPLFHAFANSLFNTTAASKEQIDAVIAYYRGNATEQQKALIENTPSYQQHQALKVSYRDPLTGSSGTWDLTTVVLAHSLPEEGEPTFRDAVSYPDTPPEYPVYFNDEGILVIRISAMSDWSQYLSGIHHLAKSLGQPADFSSDRPYYNFVFSHESYVFVENPTGNKVIVPLYPLKVHYK